LHNSPMPFYLKTGRETMSGKLQGTIQHIKKTYKKRTILRDITFDIHEGECIGILGGNGSGKSTLLSILAGVQKADEGTFTLSAVGYVPQEPPLIEELTGKDNLSLWYEKKEMEKELEDGVLAMLGIPAFLKTTVSKMSGGMKKRLAIGCAACGNPTVLLLDEPSAALDLVCKERIAKYLKDYKAHGGSIILATHDVQELELCDRLFILKEGVLHPYEFDGNVHHLVGQL